MTGKLAEKALDSPGSLSTRTRSVRSREAAGYERSEDGTPAVTTRGMKEAEMVQVAALIQQGAREARGSDASEPRSRDVKELTRGFPIYKGLLDDGRGGLTRVAMGPRGSLGRFRHIALSSRATVSPFSRPPACSLSG